MWRHEKLACSAQQTSKPVSKRCTTLVCLCNWWLRCGVQAPAERACAKFAAGANVAEIQAVNPRPIKRSTIVSYIAAAAANTSENVDFGRLAEEAGLTYQAAATIASGKALLRRMHVAAVRVKT